MRNRFLLLLLLLIATGGSSMCQSTLWLDNTSMTDSAIVRHWHGGEYVVCAHETSGGYYFQYHDNASNTTRRVNLPTGVRINDFRIFRDTVYVGGSMAGQGLLACFPVQDLLGAGLSASWVLMRSINMQGGDCSVEALCQVTSITRLALFAYGGVTHVAFVAPNQILTMSGNVEYNRIGLGDAVFNGTGWNIKYLYNKDGIEVFTDIAATDNYVVASSVTNDSMLVQFRVYHQGADYLNASILPADHCWSTNEQHGIGKAMVAPMTGDAFALASHYKNGTDEGVAAKVFQIAGSSVALTQNFNLPIASANIGTWEMGDLRYCPATNLLLLVDQIEDPATSILKSYLFTIDLTNPANTRKESMAANRFWSLDMASGGQFLAAGNSGGDLLVLCEAVFGGNVCPQIEPQPMLANTALLYHMFHHRCIIKYYNYNSTYTASVGQSEMTIICNQE